MPTHLARSYIGLDHTSGSITCNDVTHCLHTERRLNSPASTTHQARSGITHQPLASLTPAITLTRERPDGRQADNTHTAIHHGQQHSRQADELTTFCFHTPGFHASSLESCIMLASAGLYEYAPGSERKTTFTIGDQLIVYQ